MREVFVNVVKHSRAKHVVVRVRRDDDANQGARLHLVVEDDGIGFDYARWTLQPDVGDHFGLFNVREQLACVGGTLQFESEPNRFTRAHLSIAI